MAGGGRLDSIIIPRSHVLPVPAHDGREGPSSDGSHTFRLGEVDLGQSAPRHASSACQASVHGTTPVPRGGSRRDGRGLVGQPSRVDPRVLDRLGGAVEDMAFGCEVGEHAEAIEEPDVLWPDA